MAEGGAVMDIIYTNLHTHNKHVDNHNGVWIPATAFKGYIGDVVPNSHGIPCIVMANGADDNEISAAIVMNPNFFDNYGILTGDFLFRAILCTFTNAAAGNIIVQHDLLHFALGTDIESANVWVENAVAVPVSGAGESLIFHHDVLAVATAEAVNIEGTIFQYNRIGNDLLDTYGANFFFLGVLIGWRGEL